MSQSPAMSRCLASHHTLVAGVLLLMSLTVTIGCGTNETANVEPESPVVTDADRELEQLAARPDSGVIVRRDASGAATVDLRKVDAATLPAAVEATATAENVGEVLLQGAAVTDELVEPLTRVESLRRLRAEQTNLGDATLQRLGESNRLELLYFVDAAELTPAGVAAIAKMTKLRNLRLGGEAINDDSVVAVAGLTNLAALGLLHSAVSDASIPKFSSLTGLKELMLLDVPVSDEIFAVAGELPSLKILRLRQTDISGAAADPLADSNIVELELAETDFGNAGMPAVAAMPELQELNLWLTKIDDEGLAQLAGKTQLTSLNLDNVSGITDGSLGVLAGLENLEFLHLGGTSISPEGLQKLTGLTNLKTLIVTRLGVSEMQANELRSAMPWLERLDY